MTPGSDSANNVPSHGPQQKTYRSASNCVPSASASGCIDPACMRPGCVSIPHGTDNPRAIRTLADDYLAAMLERNPELITTFGLEGRHDRLTDNSLAALATWEKHEDAFRARLAAIAPPAPGEPDWAVYGIVRE